MDPEMKNVWEDTIEALMEMDGVELVNVDKDKAVVEAEVQDRVRRQDMTEKLGRLGPSQCPLGGDPRQFFSGDFVCSIEAYPHRGATVVDPGSTGLGQWRIGRFCHQQRDLV